MTECLENKFKPSVLFRESLSLKSTEGLRIGLLVLITISLYWRSFSNEFLMLWDDQWMVFNSYTAGGLTPENLKRILTDIYYGQYSPLNQLVYTLLYCIAGYDPVVYHGFNILMHVLNVVIAYLFVNSLLTAMRGDLHPAAPEGDVLYMTANASFIAALLFAVHPVNVEAVAWVSASKIVVCSFFYLMGLYLYVRYIGSRSRLTYIAVLLLFALAFGAKEQAVAFVLCCMVIDYAVRRKESLMDLLLEKLPMILLALFFGFLTMLTHWHSGSGTMPEYTGIANRMVLSSFSTFDYISKTLVPNNLSYLYPFPYQPGERIPMRLWLFPILAIAVIVYFYRKRRNRLMMFAVLFFLANLVLMLHIIPMSRFTMVCDRYFYVALLGPATFAGWWAAYGLVRRPAITLVILIPYFLYLSAYTFAYQEDWRSSSDLKREMRKTLRERNTRTVPLDGGKKKLIILNS